MKTYNKLVRDKIPQIIQRDGKSCQTRVLSDKEYLNALNDKLTEEVNEYLASGETEELADIVEVVQALATVKGCSAGQLEEIRTAKAQERGGFAKKIFLETVQ